MNADATEPIPPTPPSNVKKRSFVRDGVLVLSAQSVHVVLNLLMGILTVNIWGSGTLGRIRVAQITTNITGVIGDLGMRKVLPYEIGKNERDKAHVIRVALTLWIVSTLGIVAFAIVPYLIPGLFNTTWWWGVLAATTMPGVLLMHYTRGIALGINRISLFANLGWIRDAGALLLIVGLGVLVGLNAPEQGWARIAAAIGASILVGGFCIRVLFREAGIGFSIDLPLMWSLLKRGVLFAMGGVLMRLNYRVDLLLLGLTVYAVSPTYIGQYSVGAALAQFVWQIPIALGHLVVSRGVRAKNPLEFSRKNARLARLGTAAALLSGVLFAVVAPYVVPVIYQNVDGVNEIHVYIWILLPGVIAFIPARLFESDLIARNLPWSINTVMGPVVLANIGLNLYLIPSDHYFNGARGAALASTITYTLGTIGMTFMYARKTGLSVREIVTPSVEDVRILIASVRRRRN